MNDPRMGRAYTDDPNFGNHYRRAWLDNGDEAWIDLEYWAVGWAGKTWVRGWVGDKLVDINVDHIIATIIPELRDREVE